MVLLVTILVITITNLYYLTIQLYTLHDYVLCLLPLPIADKNTPTANSPQPEVYFWGVPHSVVSIDDRKVPLNVGNIPGKAVPIQQHSLHKCQTCTRLFPTKESLAVHKKSHPVAKTHKCGLCNRTYIKERSLVEHMTVHTGETPYICDICGDAFSFNITLSKHKISEHGATAGATELVQDGHSPEWTF